MCVFIHVYVVSEINTVLYANTISKKNMRIQVRVSNPMPGIWARAAATTYTHSHFESHAKNLGTIFEISSIGTS